MTTDERIAHDFAVIGRESLDRPADREATLRAVGASDRPSPITASSLTGGSLQLVRLSHVFAHRVASAYAGAASVASIVALFVYLSVPQDVTRFGTTALDNLMIMEKRWVACVLGVIVLGAYLLTSRIAAQRFDAHIADAEDPLTVARGLVRRVDAWSIAAAIAGVVVFILFFGMAQVVIADHGFARYIEAGFEAPGSDAAAFVIHRMLVMLGAAIVATVIGSLLLAATSRWHAVFVKPGTLALGGLVFFATMLVGVMLDTGPTWYGAMYSQVPSFALRGVLTVTGTAGIFVIVAAIVLRRRARASLGLDV